MQKAPVNKNNNKELQDSSFYMSEQIFWSKEILWCQTYSLKKMAQT